MEKEHNFCWENDVLRYAQVENACGDTSPARSEHSKEQSKDKSFQVVAKTTENPDWLPSGWITECKTRTSGTTYKCYIHPETGRKFYSKPEVLRFLNTPGPPNNGTTEMNKSSTALVNSIFPDNLDDFARGISSSNPIVSQDHKTTGHGDYASEQKSMGVCEHSENNVVMARDSNDGLPPGWIKEIKTRQVKNGLKADPYYIDPVSGYMFRSKKDALRYVETGDITKCAIRPKKRECNDLVPINSEMSSQSVIDEKKRRTSNRRQLYAGEKGDDASNLPALEPEISKKRKRKNVSDGTAKGSKKKKATKSTGGKGSIFTRATITKVDQESQQVKDAGTEDHDTLLKLSAPYITYTNPQNAVITEMIGEPTGDVIGLPLPEGKQWFRRELVEDLLKQRTWLIQKIQSISLAALSNSLDSTDMGKRIAALEEKLGMAQKKGRGAKRY